MNFPSSDNFKMVEWTSDLDLTEFYAQAKNRGFENNASQQMLVDCFQKERQKAIWMLYYKDIIVGSVVSHSLDMFGENSFRICARTCVFTDLIPITHVRTRKRTIQEHQNITAQFYIPKCIEWAGKDSNLYISTNDSPVASQRLVHTIYCPALMETGAISSSTVHHYRGHDQTFWKLNNQKFLDQLDTYGKW
jgi:hypothetical protein